jgi:4-hydroxy-tetrahydrodipicolinate synthase
MITPFTDDNRIDFKAVRALTEWYITKGCDGIFAVCQSSEMFFLSREA